MNTFDTIYITNEDGSATWFSPEASQTEVATQSAGQHEIRKVVRADDGYVLKLGDEVLGTQMWLKDGVMPDGLTEVKADELTDESFQES